MKFLISGATGYLGFNLVLELLRNGNKVSIISRRSENSLDRISMLENQGAIVINSQERDFFLKIIEDGIPYDHVIHLAAHYSRSHSPNEVKPILEAALVLGGQMLEISKIHKSRFYYAGTYLEYMKTELIKSSLYVTSKILYENLVEVYRTPETFDVTKIIFFDTYGGDDTRDKLLNAIFESKKAGRNLILKDPNQLLNLTYISDVVEGIIKITQTPSKRILRVSSDNFIRVADLLKCVNELTTPEVMLVKCDSNLMEQFPALRFPTPETWRPDTSLSVGIKLMQKTNS